MDDRFDYLFVALIGVAVGLAEILARHRGRSFAVLWSRWPGSYALINGLLSVAVLAGIRKLGWDFGLGGDTPVRWGQVAAAGFGAMTALRSSVVLGREESGNDIGFGPAGIVQIVLTRIDHVVASERIERVAGAAATMFGDLDYEKAKVLLPRQCALLLLADAGRAPTAEEMEKLGEVVGRWAELPQDAARVNLGIYLIDEFGDRIVKLAVTTLGAAIKPAPLVAPPNP